MHTLGVQLTSVADGQVSIRLPNSSNLAQQHGYAHAGAIAAIADSACGYACLSTMPEGAAVLSVEFKVNLLAPAAGDAFLAHARVIRAGRTLSVATCEVHAESAGLSKLIAIMQATLMRVEAQGGQVG